MRSNQYIFITLIAILSSCNKYLNEKPNKQLYVPENWQDLQALLDANSIMNFESGSAVIELISGNFYINEQRWNSGIPSEKGVYIWNDKEDQVYTSWSMPYRCVYVSNVVLDNLDRIKDNTPIGIVERIEGSALFFRAFSYYYLLQLYAPPFSPKAETDLGIVLKKTGSVSESITRSSVKDCYTQIIHDLERSVSLLNKKEDNVLRPSSIAANALLARVCLSMSDYENARKFSEVVLQDKPDLVDFNNLVPIGFPVMPSFLSNPEIIFANVLSNTSFNLSSAVIIDTSLYESYNENDIRKLIYFTTSSAGGVGKYRFRGSYYELSSGSTFYGLTTNEIYLTLSECLIRKGEVTKGLEFLNQLLRKRYYHNKFEEVNTTDASIALDFVLQERRKELLFRGTHWTDLRRLNLEGRNITLTRVFSNNQVYSLPPNDKRSVLLIPNEEIIRSSIKQNPR